MKNYIISFLLVAACTSKSDPHSKHAKHEKHPSANEFMHKSSFDELIQRFESPERDEYQKPTVVLELLGDLNGKTVMDIGAGSGYFTFRLADQGAHVIAADVDDAFLEHIKKKRDEFGISNIELRKIPYDNPSLQQDETDLVLVVNTYHHIENRSEYFEKVRQGINQEGELVIIDFFKTEVPVGPPVDHKIAMDQVIDELKMAGFKNFEIDVNSLPYQFIIRAN